jgi:hypothetical protein
MGTDHNEVVALSHLADGCDGITRTDLGGHHELWAGQCQGRVLYDLFGVPLTVFGPVSESDHQLFADIVERSENREDGDRDRVLKGV